MITILKYERGENIIKIRNIQLFLLFIGVVRHCYRWGLLLLLLLVVLLLLMVVVGCWCCCCRRCCSFSLVYSMTGSQWNLVVGELNKYSSLIKDENVRWHWCKLCNKKWLRYILSATDFGLRFLMILLILSTNAIIGGKDAIDWSSDDKDDEKNYDKYDDFIKQSDTADLRM